MSRAGRRKSPAKKNLSREHFAKLHPHRDLRAAAPPSLAAPCGAGVSRAGGKRRRLFEFVTASSRASLAAACAPLLDRREMLHTTAP